MSKYIFGSIVLVLSVICFVNGETSVKVTIPQKNPEYPNKCWDDASQTAYSVGSHLPEDSCERVHCYPDFRIKFTSCGTHSGGEGYTIEQDLTKAYPDCCAKLVKVDKKPKRVEHIDAREVKFNKFRTRDQAVVLKQQKKAEPTSAPESSSSSASATASPKASATASPKASASVSPKAPASTKAPFRPASARARAPTPVPVKFLAKHTTEKVVEVEEEEIEEEKIEEEATNSE